MSFFIFIQIKPEYKKKELPTVRKFRIKSIDTEFVNKAKAVLEKYLIVSFTGSPFV